MNTFSEEQAALNKLRLEALQNDEALLRKVIRIAQFESEVDLGVNPTNQSQANTGNLTEQDFEYIKRVCILVEKRLKDSVWLTNTLDEIENKSIYSRQRTRGVRFDDELFKAGRGILESVINEKYNENK